jgi:hypothetical protein
VQGVPDQERKGVEEALARFMPVLTAGMGAEEAGDIRKTCLALFTLRASRLAPGEFEQEIRGQIRRAEGLPLEGRRRMSREAGLALEVERLSGQVSGTALRVLRKETEVTREMRRETRRTLARLGRLNAALVGRFPHRTELLGQVSEAYLDAMFILGGGEGPAGTRLQKLRKERESAEKER